MNTPPDPPRGCRILLFARCGAGLARADKSSVRHVGLLKTFRFTSRRPFRRYSSVLAGGLYKHYRNHRRVSVVEAGTPEVYSLPCLRVVFLRGPFGSRRVTAVRFPSRATTICGRRVTAVSFPALDGGRSERAAQLFHGRPIPCLSSSDTILHTPWRM